ncbi:GTP 3',8-cyclase MoaA [Terrisporobacter petrolearius]|uniref:GTP 3',8-cyclase MoaA n=1 Tax=Terrisporobacter petrolearius TaxID=1460447 RepID=UPI001D165646|nr:GTP 3',8-cyclase MoaA [Terrisporobacter petrolearius]MCC3863075.1 GTP 3',8-cyclase MoaA [Terrisporobacter petrolearius]
MKDSYSREINYLRISLTDKCDLRCVYCKEEDETVEDEYVNNILSFDDYKFIIKNFKELGVNKIKFIGGEPLLYPYLKDLIYFAKHECNIEDISITTNGQHFSEKALELKNSGLDRVNLSIDSLKEYKYNAVTRGGSLTQVLNALNTCIRLKLPVKINCVLIDEFNTDEVYDFIRLTKYNNVDVRFVELTPWGSSKRLYDLSYVNTKELMESLEDINISGFEEDHNVKYYKMEKSKGRVGIISPISDCFCERCNKMIITNDGFVRLCLYADEEIDLRDFLHKPIMFKEVIKDLLKEKPRNHTLV